MAIQIDEKGANRLIGLFSCDIRDIWSVKSEAKRLKFR